MLTRSAISGFRDVEVFPEPLRVAIIGTDGCAASHHRALAVLETEGSCELVGTCDPWSHRGLRPAHIKSGLTIYPDHLRLLADLAGKADYVAIPTPIHLHAEMHRDVLAAGFACYLEKPPTLDPRELKDMLALEATASRASFVGFSHLFRPEYAALKTRLLDGEFGELREVNFVGMWPRTRSYFERNSWAGRLRFNDKIILDSCLGNGMAHHVHNCLFWSGQDAVWSWDHADFLQAHLYRANRIEAPDTIFLEARCASGIRLRMALTHACTVSRTEEILHCDRATVRISYGLEPGISIESEGRNTESIPLTSPNSYVENHRWYGDYLRGRRERPCTLLSDCRGAVHLNALAYVSAGQIKPVSPHLVRTFRRNGAEGVEILGMEEKAISFLADGHPPDFADPATTPSKWVGEGDLSLLVPTISRMLEESQGDSLILPTGLPSDLLVSQVARNPVLSRQNFI